MEGETFRFVTMIKHSDTVLYLIAYIVIDYMLYIST